ncbi:MAG: tRNA preQ1(34) S-adenosylmethionine ribosyltransferase-isomerase QueA [Armatimonadota bacterium]|nr:tRNA preQ1(34) S-adenosylmethionine ribosyltransferase-isomerase QueA [Armatimonadota bacterium]
MLLKEFDYDLPEELIAQEPLPERDMSRLMVVDRSRQTIEHHIFREFPQFLREGDVLVLNNTRVIPARLLGHKETGGRVEALLLERREPGIWEAMVKPGRRVPVGTVLRFDSELRAEVVDRTESGGRILRFFVSRGVDEAGGSTEQLHRDGVDEIIARVGQVPLPPYIHKPVQDPERYQTVYAASEGSTAAPTAGLHFTPALLERIRAQGVKIAFVTLHVGIATFRPVRTANIEEHRMHTERYEIPEETAEVINSARGRIVCVGTTTARALESAAVGKHQVRAVVDETGLYIRPGYEFKIVDVLVTNFHMPKSTLLIMVSAFAGVELIKKAYQEAISRKYRFLSFGDAMMLC